MYMYSKNIHNVDVLCSLQDGDEDQLDGGDHH
jgi:hypothetical protein